MKNFKKFAISLALTFMIALCPILCMACCGTTDTNGKNIAKALGDAIAIIENHNAENTDVEENSLTTSAMDVEFLPLGQDVQVNVIQLDYIKEIAASSKFKYTTLPIKGEAVVSQGNLSQTVLSYNKFSIVDNLITAEMYFFVEEAQSTDYEWIQIDYDFENNKVNSFVLYQYVTIQSEEDFCSAYKYENETLSIANQEDSNFAEFKNSVKEMSTGLADAQEFAQEYDFTAEYIKVYNTYNPNSPLE